MNLNFSRIGVICMATLAAPCFMIAQAGSPGNQPGQQLPQQPGGTPGAGTPGAMPGPSAGGDPTVQMKDKLFLRTAAEGGMAEVQMGQLAAQKGGSDEVKQFGQKMVDDHTMLNNAMKPIADSMGVRAPTKLNKKDQQEFDKLNGLSGDAFDKEYLTFMSKDHHNDLKEFKEEDMTAGDPSLKAAVDKGIQVIQQHTMMVDQLAKSKGAVVSGKS